MIGGVEFVQYTEHCSQVEAFIKERVSSIAYKRLFFLTLQIRENVDTFDVDVILFILYRYISAKKTLASILLAGC